MKKLFLFFLSIGISLQAVAGYVEGENAFNEQNYALAFDEFLPLAEEGDYRSQYYIGYLYVNGLGVQKDGKKGVEYLQKAVDQNHDMAQALMGYLYSEGLFVRKDKKKALELYQLAAASNNISANLNLGVMYYKGDSVPRDYDMALQYFSKVPLESNPIVCRYLGDIYYNNPALKDYKKASQYYELSARQNDLNAYYNLGEMYRTGTGMEKDIKTAITYHKYAASKGYVASQYILGVIYANGEGVAKDKYKAVAWLQIASDQGMEAAKEAMDKLTKNMSLTDVQSVSRQVVLIQQNEMGKIDPPFDPQTKMEGVAALEGVAQQPRQKRRRTLRRRRR